MKTNDHRGLAEMPAALPRAVLDWFACDPSLLRWKRAGRGGLVSDSPSVYLVSSAEDDRELVLLMSSPSAPGMVQLAMKRAREAKALLGPPLDGRILEPIHIGTASGLTYATLPRCIELSRNALASTVQSAALSRPILAWHRAVVEKTCHTCDRRDTEAYAHWLQRLESESGAGPLLNGIAKRALGRLRDGRWTPRLALMHGDFWKGNILLRQAPAKRARWGERFVVIDWAGSNPRGVPIFDLVRMAESLQLGAGTLRRHVADHCESLLGCDPEDAFSYLASALGAIAAGPGQFQFERLRLMGEECVDTLERAGQRAYLAA
jgi:hypothetical protein